MTDKSKAINDLLANLDTVIGRGPHGVVYTLKNAADEAVKELELEGAPPDIIEIVETRLSSMQFFKHPNILHYKKVFRNGDTFYLHMRRYNSSLEQMIKIFKRRRMTIPEAKALDITYQITSALEYLHASGIRDPLGNPISPTVMQHLQPSQVLIDNDDMHYVLSDFCVPKDCFNSRSSFEITPVYRAPESINTNKYTPASDIWSVGCILYELMTMSSPPFIKDADDNGVFPENWKPDLSKVKSLVGQEILKRLLVVDPQGRLSAAQLVNLLKSDNQPDGLLTALKIKILEIRCINYDTELTILREKYQRQEEEMVVLKERLLALEKNQQPLSDSPTISPERKRTLLSQEEENNSEHRWLQRAETAYNEHPGLVLLDSLADIVRDSYRNAAKNDVPNKPADDGTTDLMYAAHEGNIEMVEQLVMLEKGLQNKNGWTALMIALMQKHTEVALFLVQYENGLHDNKGKTALMWAAQSGMTEVAKELVAYEKGFRDILGQTALMLAAQNGNADIVRLLASHEQRMQDNNGESAIIKAVHWGHANAVKFLIPLERDMKDRRGRTALDHAKAEGRQAIISLFAKT